MRQAMIALLATVTAASGCSAAKTAMGLLSPKPPQVTVVNNLQAPPPAPVTVTVQQPENKSSPLTAIAVGGAAGLLAGGVLGMVLDKPVAPAAAIGGGIGALTGLLVHEVD